jgi:hypothetical protein
LAKGFARKYTRWQISMDSKVRLLPGQGRKLLTSGKLTVCRSGIRWLSALQGVIVFLFLPTDEVASGGVFWRDGALLTVQVPASP